MLDEISVEKYLNLRYRGTDVAFMIQKSESDDYLTPFLKHYEQEFGFVLNREVLIDDVRVRAVGRTQQLEEKSEFTDNPGKFNSCLQGEF